MPAPAPVNVSNRRRPARRSRRSAAVALVLASATIAAACSSTSGTSSTSSSAPGSTTAGSTPSGSAPSGTAPTDAILELDGAAMDAVVNEVATGFHEVGMVVLIRTPKGDYVNTWGTVGLDSTEAPTLDTKVRVGSNTKTWTGTAILQMVQEGKLALDDPVSDYRPDVPNGENITIGDLLNMRSGLFNYTETLELNTALDEEPEKVWTPEGLLALAFANPPYFPPGEGYHYSNTNTILLGLIAEELDAKPIAQIFQDRFFTPLGMADTSFPANTDDGIPAPYSRGYMFGTNVETLGEGNESLSADQLAAIDAGEVQPHDMTNNNPSWTWSAGQGISTANDLLIWVEAMVEGELLDEKTQALRMDGFQSTDPSKPDAAQYSYAMAQMGPMFGHTGELGGYNSFMGHDPVNDVTIVAWGNLAPTADGKGPAAFLVRELVPFVYAMPAKGETDDIDEASAAE